MSEIKSLSDIIKYCTLNDMQIQIYHNKIVHRDVCTINLKKDDLRLSFNIDICDLGRKGFYNSDDILFTIFTQSINKIEDLIKKEKS